MAPAVNVEDLTGRETSIITLTLVALSTVVVLVRVGATLGRHKHLFADDYFAILSEIFLITTFGLTVSFSQSASDPNITPLYIVQVTVAINIFLDLTLWICKVPLLLLYVRLFGIKKWMRYTCYFILVASFLPSAAGVIANGISCSPKGNTVTAQIFSKCEDISARFNVIIGFVSVFVDAMIFLLPLLVIRGLKLSLRKRLGLIAVFLVGVIAIIASSVSLYFKWVTYYDTPGYATAYTIVFTALECSTALIVACVPSLSSFYTNILAKSLAYSKLRSKFSRSFRTQPPSVEQLRAKSESPDGIQRPPYAVTTAKRSAVDVGHNGQFNNGEVELESLRPSR